VSLSLFFISTPQLSAFHPSTCSHDNFSIDTRIDIELATSARDDVRTFQKAEKAGPGVVDLPFYNNEVSFRSVASVDIALWRLTVTVEKTMSAFEKLRSRLSEKKTDNHENENAAQIKIFLGGVSADLPRETLTAIIGGSGSGKTTLRRQPFF
jgi:ABC-type glutathione transport system ATPase component